MHILVGYQLPPEIKVNTLSKEFISLKTNLAQEFGKYAKLKVKI